MQSLHFRNATLRSSETGPTHVAVLKGRDEQRHWTQLGIAAVGAFLPGPSAISTATAALGAAAILQPLSECTVPAALATTTIIGQHPHEDDRF